MNSSARSKDSRANHSEALIPVMSKNGLMMIRQPSSSGAMVSLR